MLTVPGTLYGRRQRVHFSLSDVYLMVYGYV